MTTFNICDKTGFKINNNNSIIDNKQIISETFNEFFCDIGSKLANNFLNNNILRHNKIRFQGESVS